jgi:hypothetical protein
MKFPRSDTARSYTPPAIWAKREILGVLADTVKRMPQRIHPYASTPGRKIQKIRLKRQRLDRMPTDATYKCFRHTLFAAL